MDVKDLNIVNPSRILGAAVVGLGVGELHAEKYSSLSNCKLCLVYDLNKNKAKRVAERFGCGYAKEFEQILNDPQIDIISIASFDDAHCEQIINSLSAGKHTFVEKPMCNTFTELEAIKSAWNNCICFPFVSLLANDRIPLNINSPCFFWAGVFQYGR